MNTEKKIPMKKSAMEIIIRGIKNAERRYLDNGLEMMTFTDEQLKLFQGCVNNLHAEYIDTIILPGEPITDTGVSYLAEIPWIKDLDLSGCVDITNIGVEIIGENLKNLESLILSINPNVTNITPLKNLKNLKLLNLYWTNVEYTCIDIDWIKNSSLLFLDIENTPIRDNDKRRIMKILEDKRKDQQIIP